ncbi:MAG: hypothetical protein AAF288_03070 [Planctomycetota bacterium]
MSDAMESVVRPVFDVLSMDRAMGRLLVRGGVGAPDGLAEAVAAVGEAVASDVLAERPDVCAALWLFVDDIDKAHAVCGALNTPTGSYWHAIVHRREGDFDNSKYWYRKAGNHPAMRRIDLTGGGAGSGTDVAKYDPFAYVDQVRMSLGREGLDGEHPELVSVQHREWRSLFEWCAER